MCLLALGCRVIHKPYIHVSPPAGCRALHVCVQVERGITWTEALQRYQEERAKHPRDSRIGFYVQDLRSKWVARRAATAWSPRVWAAPCGPALPYAVMLTCYV